MTARFMLTFDCEGKWGVADRLGPSEQRSLTDSRLGETYRSILELLDEFAISATFAFVGLFTQSRRRFVALRDEIEDLKTRSPYLCAALDNILASDGSGWHGNRLVEAVAGASISHEIALHGVTHVPWTMVDRSFAETELRLLDEFEGSIRTSRTFVYPRNLVAHVDVLADRQFLGFRAALPRRSRASSLLSELNLFERPQRAIAGQGIVPIPAGFFVNWRHGLRKLIPPSLSLKRASVILRRAARSHGIVHYWLHPENIATEPATLAVLRAIVEEAARARDAGSCEVLTQMEYCFQVGRMADRPRSDD